MSSVKVIRLQKRQKNVPTNTSPNEELLAPFPTVPPIIGNNTTNNGSTLENTVTESGDDGVSEGELLGLAGGGLIVIVLIVIFIRRKMAGDSSKSSDSSKSGDNDRSAGYMSYSSSNYHNEQRKSLPMMMDQNSSSSQLILRSSRTYDLPLTPSSDSPSINNNYYSSQNKNPVDPSSREILPYSPQTSNSTQKDLSYSPDSHRGPSLDDDSLHLLQPKFSPNFQQKDPSYPSDSYKRSSRDGHSSPYLPQSSFTPNTPNIPNTPNTPNTPMTPPYPPNTYNGPSQDDYPSPFLPPSPYLSPSNFQQREQLHQPNSYGGSQNYQSHSSSQQFQQQYYIDPTQGTSLSPQQYRSPPHSPHSLEDPPRSPLFSKSEPIPTNDQNSSSMSYQDTPLVSSMVDNTNNNNNMDENLSLNSDATNTELKEIDDMIANIINSENLPSTLPKNFSHISDSSFTKLLSDIPITSTNENSNRPDSQASSMYSVQPTQRISQIEMASENKIPSSNPDHDHVLPQMMQSAAVSYIEPTQSNMVIEHVNEPSGTSEVQLNMTQSITNQFIQPSQSNMKIEKVESFRPEISAPIMTGVAAQVGPKPMYDIMGIKKHAEKVLSAKSEKKFDSKDESNSESVNETQNIENVVKENDDNQGGSLVRKKSVRFQTESNQEEPIKGSKTKKSILINKDDVKNIQSSDYDSRDEKENNRNSNSSGYDFDISGYQDDIKDLL